MNGFFQALAFLTILPVRGTREPMDHTMLAWIPAVGMVIGLLLAGFDASISLVLPPLVRAVLDIVFLIVITGGIHLDGLADAADGILAHRGREQGLEIMRDSRLGTWGAIALFAVLMLDWSALATLTDSQGTWRFLLLAPIYSRTAMLLGIRSLPYGRPEGGMALSLFGTTNPALVWCAGLTCASAVLLPAAAFVSVNLAFVLAVWGTIRLYRKTMGCITGDMIGALNEIAQAAVLLALVV
jgi:adenosylcobinamide-GDP ribazoletransferase